jgi:uncharacterized repeat protein (TIGR01451 family)
MPGGGHLSLTATAPSPDALINDSGDILFHAPLTGGTADSGYFLRTGGVWRAVLVQGQPAPGTSTTFASAGMAINNVLGEGFTLGPAGDIYINNFLEPLGLEYVYGYFRNRVAQGSSVLEKVVLRFDPAPDSGGGVFVSMSQQLVSASHLVFRAAIAGGTIADGIYTAVDPAADLALTVPTPTTAVAPNMPVTYRLTISNNGPFAATGVTLTLTLPAGASFTGGPQFCSGTQTVTCTLGTIAVDGSVDVSLTLTPTAPGTLTLPVSVTGAETDPALDNNSGSIYQAVGIADVKLTLGASLHSGGNQQISLTVENQGPNDAHDVVLTDRLLGYTFVSATATQGACTIAADLSTCAIGTVPYGASGIIVTIVVEPPALTNNSAWTSQTFSASATEPDPDPTNNSVRLAPGLPDANTFTGSNITVPLSDVAVIFSSVTSPGLTTIASLNLATTPPPGFRPGGVPVLYDLKTTAQASGPITLAVSFNPANFHKPAKVRLFALENGVWVDRTLAVDPAGKITAVVAALAAIALFEPVNHVPAANPGPDRAIAATAMSGATVTLDAAASTDADGDALAYRWTGPFLEGGGSASGATLTVTLPIGTFRITLVVSDGETDSAPVAVNVAVTSFALSLSSPVTVTSGQPAIYTVTINPQFGAFDREIALSCGTLPALAACAFSPAKLVPGARTVTRTMTITTTSPLAAANCRPAWPWALWLPVGVVLAAVLGPCRPRAARPRRIITLFFLAALALPIAFQLGCGGSASPGSLPRHATPPGAYTITVTGTSGVVQSSGTATLVVR